MHVDYLNIWEQLTPYAHIWNQLAGQVPFRRWEWLAGWWRYYGQPNPHRRLAVVVVKDTHGSVIGLAPWYEEHSVVRGRVLRFLGGDEVCSDHLTLLCIPGREQDVAQVLAQWLVGAADGRSRKTFPVGHDPGNGSTAAWGRQSLDANSEAFEGWDLLELADVDRGEPALEALARSLAERGCWVERAPSGYCWVISLPDNWESFLQCLSKSHRNRLRRISRLFFTTSRAVLHTVHHPDQLPRAMELLVALHRRRRRQLGQADCFVSPHFEAFHRELAPDFLAVGCLELHWLEVDGVPVAAEYHLLGDKTIYAYQSGISPTPECPSPGEWIHLAIMRRAIEHGYQWYDFLRGDEAYKAYWCAKPQPTETLWMVAPHKKASWRYGVQRTARSMKSWLKKCLGRKTPVLAPC